ncbi:MAG: glycosyltransferase family 2 protein [Candidatus Sericytochromatia bacterium]|nr:glycosyltransferase family 2 protein [Candidatus Sericytochromatia bacterium]
MKLSLVIATSPGREHYLTLCLQALACQCFTDFEVIICDDGSDGMQGVYQPFETLLDIRYDWRPNDRNLSRSRNRGAALARGEGLVFLNGDVLLNPEALQAYHDSLLRWPGATFWGYVGCRKSVSAPSLWFPEARINWLDFRFFPVSAQQVYLHPELIRAPHRLAGGHHFALMHRHFVTLGPLNEAFQGWGDEDVEYALRGLLAGLPMYFVGDAWAEHLEHDYQEHFHLEAPVQRAFKTEVLQTLERQLGQVPPPQLIFERQLPVLWRFIQEHYLNFQPDALQNELMRRRLGF